MAGFFGLFKSKTKYIDEPEDKNTATSANESNDVYFLNSDDASSLGKIKSQQKTTKSQSESKPAIEKPQTDSKRRSADSSMDMFRKMAREIKR